jgi:hypothetical protein
MGEQDEPFISADEGLVEPFRVNAGFVGFVVLACLPAVIALVVFFGAWIVVDDVEAAEANTQPGQHAEVEGWKSTLVGLCPVH